jgi:hypothetical protein
VSENAEAVRRMFVGFQALGQARIQGALGGDFEEAAEALGELGREMARVVSPEVVIDVAQLRASFIEGRGLFQGHGGWTEFWGLWLEPWQEFDFDYGEFEDHGDHVIVDTLIKARGRESGAPVEWPMTQLWSFREGMLVRLSAYDTRQELLDALDSLDRDVASTKDDG